LDTIKKEIWAHQSKYHFLNQTIQQLEISQDRGMMRFSYKVMNEMKAYIGADEMIDLVQKARGFKTYRELYSKKIAEGENASKSLKLLQKEVKSKHEPNMRQMKIFMSVQHLLGLKMNHNKKILSGKTSEDPAVLQVTQDRLVLS
jgi:intraflagellar transport protein 81